jgi:hypothetical protein
MNKSGERYWMVMKVGGGPPRVKHWTRAAAENEAVRLAGKEDGDFVVLEAVAKFSRSCFVHAELLAIPPSKETWQDFLSAPSVAHGPIGQPSYGGTN